LLSSHHAAGNCGGVTKIMGWWYFFLRLFVFGSFFKKAGALPYYLRRRSKLTSYVTRKRKDYNEKKQSSRSTDKTDTKQNHSPGCALSQAKSRSRISSIIKARIRGGVAAAPSNTRRLRSFQMFQAV
jgi:hypothetical protein